MRLLVFITLILGSAFAAAPRSINPPAGEKLIFHAHATGDQIYICRDGAWVLSAPDARLFDSEGKQIGRHFAGPTWASTDGSEVKAKLSASAPARNPGSVDWLLLTAVDHSGSGVLSTVAAVQRLDTKGGKAPASGCDSAHKGAEKRVPYTADYYFYAKPH